MNKRDACEADYVHASSTSKKSDPDRKPYNVKDVTNGTIGNVNQVICKINIMIS